VPAWSSRRHGALPTAEGRSGLVGKRAGYAERHRVPPGITGWAQVHGLRGETDTLLQTMQRRIDHDLAYIAHRSLWLDLRILLLTVRTIWRDRNAY
jgi:putative colanic acid biosynthesis UDP-glucose lipid carrier transferase